MADAAADGDEGDSDTEDKPEKSVRFEDQSKKLCYNYRDYGKCDIGTHANLSMK